MSSKPTQLKDGVKPTENTRGAGQGAPASDPNAPEKPSERILEIIEKVKLMSESKLWRLDRMSLNDDGSDRIEVLIGRVSTRDNTRTFPAVVLRLVRNKNVVRDYTVSATVVSYLLEYLEFANDRKLSYLRDFVNAFRITSRTINAETEGDVE